MTRTCVVCNVEKDISEFHRDKLKDGGRRKDCKTCNNIKRALYYKENKKEHSDKGKRYYQKNKEKIKQKSREYYHANSKEINRSRRFRIIERRVKRNQNGVYKVLKKEIDRMYNQPCSFCGSSDNIHIDHVVPISRGGRHSVGNIQPLCSACNLQKHNKYMIEWIAYRKKYCNETEAA